MQDAGLRVREYLTFPNIFQDVVRLYEQARDCAELLVVALDSKVLAR